MALRTRTSQKRRDRGPQIDAAGEECAGDDNDDDFSDASNDARSGGSSSRSSEWTNSDGSGSVTVTLAMPERQKFSSWDEFHSYLDKYFESTFQVFRVRTKTTVEKRNEGIRAKKSSMLEIPSDWVDYSKTLVCTCSGKYQGRGNGKRPRQETRLTDCKARISACVKVVDKSKSVFAVVINKCNPVHNHLVNRRWFLRFTPIRKALDDDVIESVDMLRKAGATHKNIMKHIVENTDINPTVQEVRNLVQSMKLMEKGDGVRHSGARLKKWTKEFCENPGNVGRIFVNSTESKKVATCITLQTQHMRLLFERFPEVLMIDSTHGTNISKYKVFSFMAHDVFGHGQFVQHSLLQNERRETLLHAIAEFKLNNPAWSRVQSILIDKDFTELSVLKSSFPEATILLCQFHVLKYLREEVASSEYRFNSWQKEQLRSTFNLLVYAQTETAYNKHRRYLRHIISLGYSNNRLGVASDNVSPGFESGIDSFGSGTQGGSGAKANDSGVGENGSGIDPSRSGAGFCGLGTGVSNSGVGEDGSRTDDGLGSRMAAGAGSQGVHPFELYFTKNWDACKELWCAYKRQNTVTLGNNTNNRLESSWKQLKEWVDAFMELDECVASIMYYQSRQERRFYEEVHKMTSVQHAHYDREMLLVANMVSQHACELIFEQYVFATTRANYRFYLPYPDVYYIHSTSRCDDALDEPRVEYTVSKATWTCSCLFMATRLLPCRHVFYIRKHIHMEAVIPTQKIHERWLLTSIRSTITMPELPRANFAVVPVAEESNSAWDSNRKFREANLVASSISDTMAGLGMKDYKLAMKALQSVADIMKHKEFDRLLQYVGDSSSKNHGNEPTIAFPHRELRNTSARSTNNSDTSINDGPFGDSQQQSEYEDRRVRSSSANEEIDGGFDFGQEENDWARTTRDPLSLLASFDQQFTPDLSEDTQIELGQVEPEPRAESPNEPEPRAESPNEPEPRAESPNEPEPRAESPFNQQSGKTTLETQDSSTPVAPVVNDDIFEIASPVRSRGRPKTKPKTKKKRFNMTIQMTEIDSTLFDMGISLTTISDHLSTTPTYSTSAELFRRFQLYVFNPNPKPPVAREISKLSSGTNIATPDQLTRVLPKKILTSCNQKVTKLQSKSPGLPERDIAVEILGVGVFDTNTLAIMTRWHRAIGIFSAIDKATIWISKFVFDGAIGEMYYRVDEDPNLVQKLRDTMIQSEKIEALDLAANGSLSDATLCILMKKMFEPRPDIVTIDPGYIGIVADDRVSPNIDKIYFKNVFFGVSDERVLIPVNCNGNHWCAILIDLPNECIYAYDPMASRYLQTVRAVAQNLIYLLPRPKQRYKYQQYTTRMGIQTDNYNCGIYILLAFEAFSGAPDVGPVNSRLLQILRYRYLRMVF